MKHLKKYIAIIAGAALLVCALAGCSATQTQSAEDQAAAQNRQYMATLNQQMDDLQTTMNSFQEAVSNKDVVGMQAQASNVDKIVDSVKNTDATDRLKTVKDDYVDALCTLDDAMDAYVSLYTDVQNGTVDTETYNQRLTDVQNAYNDGMNKLQGADQAVEQVAQN